MSKWEIEISSEASEEEIIEALSKEIDFDEVRENINKLKELNNKVRELQQFHTK